MLEFPPGRIGDLFAPIVDPAALLSAIESAARVPGHPLTKKYRNDMERIRAALAT